MTRVAAFLTLCLLLCGSVARASDNADARACKPAAAAETLFTADDMLLVSVTVRNNELTDSLPIYSSRAGNYVPLGDLARLLGLAILPDPPQKRATGWIVSEDRRFEMSLDCGRAQVGGVVVDFAPDDATLHQNEVFVRTTLLQRVLPLSTKVNKSELTMEVMPRERLPFEDRVARERRREGLSNEPAVSGDVLRVPHTYALFSAPTIDLGLRGELANGSASSNSSWEVRLGGDLAYANLQLFAGSDANFEPSAMRVMLERKDPEGEGAGFFGATRSTAGDVYAPSLALGASSAGGRGVTMTSQPLDQASVFSTTDIRGELPLGYEVELYINEVLRGSQAEPVRGNFEFLNVPLAYGLNVIRLVFYGPRGERREELRKINVGSEQLEAGKASYSIGLLQQDAPLFDLSDDSNAAAIAGKGSMRFIGSMAYGVSENLTVSAGLAHFTPSTSLADGPREMAVAGALTSVFGLSVEAHVSVDSEGGAAEALGAGGRIADVSFLVRHAEYSGGFFDETQIRDLSVGVLRRASSLTADTAIHFPFDAELPVTIHGQHSEFEDGGVRWLADAHTSSVVGPVLVSGGFQYQLDDLSSGESRTASGTVDASSLVWRGWRTHFSAAYEVVPDLRLDQAQLLWDGPIGENMMLRWGVSHAFGTGGSGGASDDGTTTLLSSLTWQMPQSDLSLFASYSPEPNEVHVGMQVALSAIFDPDRKSYDLVRPGAAAGGNLIVNAFVDQNGNGKRDDDEKPMPGIRAQAGNWPATSDDEGRIVASGLGDGAVARVHIDPESIDDPFLIAPAGTIEFVPDPGKVVIANYPLRPLGEIGLKLVVQSADGTEQGVSAVFVQLVSNEGNVVVEGHTEFDGAVVLDRVPPGSYSVRISEHQTQALGLILAAPINVTMPVGGGFVGGLKGRIVFGAGTVR